MQIIVKITLDHSGGYGSSTITLDVDSSDTINDVKGQIRDKEGLEMERQRILYGG
eukprot:CAMPEP_0169398392 /NCGR_PEP_ID=MMETSP1017-20121227/52612_1 /TAXON_ID=342587 /ORGANISM="Karlodinium micrum, Strain CCMP2283" /LENGTH=54 /DNA_ID=CAMNT_0009503365 /DNA_START=62 /DNA_END=222 /DNA_ORIENTATION=+